MNAAVDALRPIGVTFLDMPLTPMRMWEAIEAARGSGAGPPDTEQGATGGDAGSAGSGPTHPAQGGGT